MSLLLVVMVFSGCGEEQKKTAQNLVKHGSNTSDGLAKYYDSLVQKRADYLALYRLDKARTDRPVEAETEKAFKEQQEALGARAQMAHKLHNVYSALGDLIDYDAPGEISGAVKDLKSQIESVANKKLALPGLAGVDPSPILDKAVKALATWAQLRQFRKNSKNAEAVVDSITHLYQSEEPIYVQIAQDYDKETKAIAEFLFKNGQASGLTSFQKYLDLYGLQANTLSSTDNAVKAWTLDRLNRELEARKSASQDEADAKLKSLQGLKKLHEDYLSGKKAEKEPRP